ncbi:hypothetical protein TYRP_010488 [Tyrophagus putrescentiae]|nr:hypothetical protein TYRP_010488 [Tyrophagus putrescentiae]
MEKFGIRFLVINDKRSKVGGIPASHHHHVGDRLLAILEGIRQEAVFEKVGQPSFDVHLGLAVGRHGVMFQAALIFGGLSVFEKGRLELGSVELAITAPEVALPKAGVSVDDAPRLGHHNGRRVPGPVQVR